MRRTGAFAGFFTGFGGARIVFALILPETRHGSWNIAYSAVCVVALIIGVFLWGRVYEYRKQRKTWQLMAVNDGQASQIVYMKPADELRGNRAKA